MNERAKRRLTLLQAILGIALAVLATINVATRARLRAVDWVALLGGCAAALTAFIPPRRPPR